MTTDKQTGRPGRQTETLRQTDRKTHILTKTNKRGRETRQTERQIKRLTVGQ